MRKMFKSIIGISFMISTLYCYSSNGATRIHSSDARFIIFGDSLSDTGNYPEPANISSPSLKNYNLYVPVTNPVPSDLYGKGFIPSRDFLKASIGQQGKINGQQKMLFSINWPLYLVYNVDKARTPLISWYHYYTTQARTVTSINYAWASAVTGSMTHSDLCFHTNGSPFSEPCNAQSMIQHRNQYIYRTTTNPNYDKNTDYAYSELQIPDLGKQVSLYLNDHTISTQDNTYFIIYIGANDIGNFFKNHTLSIIFRSTKFSEKRIDAQTQAAVNNILTAIKRINAAYQATHHTQYTITVLTLPKVSNLHSAYLYRRIPLIGTKITKLLDYAISTYNQKLITTLSDVSHVRVINSGAYIDTLASQKQYASSIKQGLTCIEDPSHRYTDPAVSVNNNCNYSSHNQQLTYFSWNNSHFVAQINQSLAAYLINKMALTH